MTKTSLDNSVSSDIKLNKEEAERIKKAFGERKESETLNSYVRRIVKLMEHEIGFSDFHRLMWKIFKSYSQGNRKVYQRLSTVITGNEKLWLKAIAEIIEE